MLSAKKSSIEKQALPFIVLFKDTNPNVLTLLGSIPSLLFFVFLINHWYLLAILAFLGNSFDLIDGLVARTYNKVTAFGGFLDSTMDRVADFFIIAAFAFAGIVRWEIVAPLLLCAFLTSYTRSRGELANRAVSFAIGIIERTERLTIIIVALILYLLFPIFSFQNLNVAEWIFLFLVFLSFYTTLQRILHACKNL